MGTRAIKPSVSTDPTLSRPRKDDMPAMQSRQMRRINRLTKDPDGPQLKRVDVHVSPRHWSLLDAIRNYGNLKQATAVEKAIEAQFLAMVVDGTIPAEVVAESRIHPSETLKENVTGRLL